MNNRGAGRPQRRVLLSGLAALLLALIWLCVVRIVLINREIPTPPTVAHQQGEEIMCGNVGVTITGAAIIDGESVSELTSITPVGLGLIDSNRLPRNPQDFKFLLADIRVANHGASAATVELYPFTMQSGAWANGMSLPLFHDLNKTGTSLDLASGEARTIRLPFVIMSDQFNTAGDWRDVDQRPFDLVLTQHPTIHLVHLMNY